MKKIIFKKNCTILIILRVLCGEEPSRVRVIDVCKRFTSNLNYILLLSSNNTANFFERENLMKCEVRRQYNGFMRGKMFFHLLTKIFANIIVKHV